MKEKGEQTCHTRKKTWHWAEGQQKVTARSGWGRIRCNACNCECKWRMKTNPGYRYSSQPGPPLRLHTKSYCLGCLIKKRDPWHSLRKSHLLKVNTQHCIGTVLARIEFSLSGGVWKPHCGEARAPWTPFPSLLIHQTNTSEQHFLTN